jgi:hypothetical protein
MNEKGTPKQRNPKKIGVERKKISRQTKHKTRFNPTNPSIRSILQQPAPEKKTVSTRARFIRFQGLFDPTQLQSKDQPLTMNGCASVLNTHLFFPSLPAT